MYVAATRIKIEFASGQGVGVLIRKEPTPTAMLLMSRLPFESSVHRWGEEIYFDAPFHSDLEEDAHQDMDIGDVAFWPDGNAIAIFFGPTPASTGQTPRAYSPCNIVGRVEGDLSSLKKIREGTRVVVKRG